MIGRHRREVLLLERRDLDVPDFLAGPRVDLHQVVVVRLHEEVVVPHADAAMAGVRAAACLPVELPEDRAVARIDRPDVVGRRRVQHAVDHEDRPANLRRTAGVELAGAFAGDRQRNVCTTATGPPRPPTPPPPAPPAPRPVGPEPWTNPREIHAEAQVLDGRLVDLRERAVASPGVVAGVGQPRLAEWLEDRCRDRVRPAATAPTSAIGASSSASVTRSASSWPT